MRAEYGPVPHWTGPKYGRSTDMMRPVIVMAGTPVDTQMGMDCLAAQGVEGVFCSISKDPVEQTAFQISSPAELLQMMILKSQLRVSARLEIRTETYCLVL